MASLWRLVQAMAILAILVAPTACGSSAADTPSSSPSPASSTTPTAAQSLWRTGVLSYPDDILAPATTDVGERSFPYRDIAVSAGGLQLWDASARYATLTDRDSSQLRLVDLRTGKSRVVLASPFTSNHPPTSMWVKARAAMREVHGAEVTPTRFLSAEVSGSRLVWREGVCLTTGGFAVISVAIYTAPIGPRMRLGDPQLVALALPESVPDLGNVPVDWYEPGDWLDFALDGNRILLERQDQHGTYTPEVVDLETKHSTALLGSVHNSRGIESALLGKRMLVCLMTREDSGRLLFYDLRRGSLPMNVALLPETDLIGTDLRGFALGKDGSVAWAKWYSPSEMSTDDFEAVYLISPSQPVRCVTADGGAPTFFGKTILWIGLKNGSRWWLGGADTETLERFSVAGADRLGAINFLHVAGSGHTAVVLVPDGERGVSTLRVFDLE